MGMNYENVIVFDGLCNFCSWAVNFIIKRDCKRVFMFAAMQSSAGAKILSEHRMSFEGVETLVLIRDGKCYTKSDAALRIVAGFGWRWRLLLVFWAVPGLVRNYAYVVIARNRYKWFGRRDQCMVPTEDVRARFID